MATAVPNRYANKIGQWQQGYAAAARTALQSPGATRLSPEDRAALQTMAQTGYAPATWSQGLADRVKQYTGVGGLDLSGLKYLGLILGAGVAGAALSGGVAGAAATATPAAAGTAAAPAAAAPVLEGGTTLAANLGASSALPALTATTAGPGAGIVAGDITDAATQVPGFSGVAGKTSWLSPLLQTIVPTAGNLIGTTIATKGNTDAAKIQAQSTQNALDFEKQAYADLTARLAPYFNAGASSQARQNAVLGLGSPDAPQAPQTVKLRAPTGEVEEVPVAQKDFYIQHGAVAL